jgi:hypothetical protein
MSPRERGKGQERMPDKRPYGFLIGIAVLAAALALLSCASAGARRKKMTAVLPSEFDVPGWKMEGVPYYHGGESMARHLGERFPLYMSYGVREMAGAGYVALREPPGRVSVAVYLMGSALDAFGVLGRERGTSPAAAPEPSLEDSHYAGGVFCFRKGPWYVRVEGERDDCLVMARVVRERIRAKSGHLPGYVTVFGERGAGPPVYYAGAFPELPAVKDVFLRARDFGAGARGVLLAAREGDGEAAREFSLLLKEAADPFVLTGTDPFQLSFRSRREGGYFFMGVHRRWLFGVADVGTMAEGQEIMGALYQELSAYIREGER